MDAIGQPLGAVIQQLDALQCKYNLVMTRPPRSVYIENDVCLYVIRQRVSDDGVYHLIVTPKMEKEDD